MNPKKRLDRILSALLALVLLLSLAFAAFAEEQPEVDPELIDGVPIDGGENGGSEIDQPSSTHTGTNVEIDYPPSSPASEPDDPKSDFGKQHSFRDNTFYVPDYEIPVEPKLPPMWGEGLTSYVDNAISAVEETAAGGTMTIRADESGMTTVSRTVLQAFEDRGDFDLECYYDRFGTVMKLVIPAGTKVIEHIGNASFVEFNTLADRLGITPLPEEEENAEPDKGSIHVVDTALWLRESKDGGTGHWYNVKNYDITHIEDSAIVSLPWYKPEDGLTKIDLLTADGQCHPL